MNERANKRENMCVGYSALIYCNHKTQSFFKDPVCVCELQVHTATLTFLFFCMQGDAKVEGEVSETVTLCFVSAGCKAG